MRRRALALPLLLAICTAAAQKPGDNGAFYQSGLDGYLSIAKGETLAVFGPAKSASPALNYSQMAVDYDKLVADHVTAEDLQQLRAAIGKPDSRCDDVSHSLGAEAFHPSMLVRNRTVRTWPGGVPKAYWQWQGRITRDQFNATPYWLRKAGFCPHCTYSARYKLLDGQLYRKCADGHCAAEHPQTFQVVEEQLILAAHFYNLPNVDFIIQFGDGAGHTFPVLQFNINISHPNAGFTMPYQNSWRQARSLRQALLWSVCLQMRNPQEGRAPKVVWRGSTTDPTVNPIPLRLLLNLTRVRLHIMGQWHPDVLDVRLIAITQGEPGLARLASKMLQVSSKKLHLEAFQEYAAVLDVDGNGWSSRFFFLLQQGTLVLKQASPFVAFFEHLFTPGRAIAQVSNGLIDLPSVARRVVDAPTQQRAAAVQQAAGLAAVTLNKWSLIEATAAALNAYARLIDWAPAMEEGYELVPPSVCCKSGGLPPEVLDAVRGAGGKGV